jgi:hypothetical protein
VLACGTCAGGLIELGDLELCLALARGRERLAPAVFTALPGKALAATSANTPVSATEPATSQRFTRLNLRSASSLMFVGLGGIG